MDSVIPFIDGGTEGFGGQSRVILPFISGCYECSKLSFPPDQNHVAMCTLAETPRIPEHCIMYAMIKLWEEKHPDRKYDTDSPDDMMWICQQAQARATKFNIEGVDYNKTLGVVKNIIPAIASTNAIIAASCVNEAMKIINKDYPSMDNYYMYVGRTGVHSHTYRTDIHPECMVCQVQ